jgi:hypothetical protein
VLKAYGASSHNGFGFTLPTLKTNDVLSVSGYDVINNSVLTLRAMGSKMVKANLPSLFLMTLTESYKNGGTGANTQLAFGYTKPITIVVNIILADRAITFRELNIGTVNPFMIVGTSVNGAPGSK